MEREVQSFSAPDMRLEMDLEAPQAPMGNFSGCSIGSPPMSRSMGRLMSRPIRWPNSWCGALTPFQPSPTAAGSAATPLAGPAAVGLLSSASSPVGVQPPDLVSSRAKAEVRASLRHAIAKIERPAALEAGARVEAPWQLGCDAADRLLPLGLDTSGVHEVKAVPQRTAAATPCASAADWMTAIGFALRLAVRRLDALDQQAVSSSERPWLMWCWPRVLSRELGLPSAAGLQQLGIPPGRLILVETAREAEGLIAVEEGLRSSSLALVLGVFDSVALTPSRRLSLAAQEQHTPCLLITHPSRAPAPAAATRWRIGCSISAPHPLLARTPGRPRFLAALERCRARPESSAQPPLSLEWSDETHRFCPVADVAGRSAAPRRAIGGCR